MRKQLTAIGVAAAIAVPLAGCGSGSQQYQPAAYGQNGHCYYVQDPYEAQQLINAGLCPAGWTPYPMPLFWHEEYAPYYGSSAYAGRYVRPSNKAKYLALAKSFYASHKTQINAAVKQAAYKLKNGKISHPCAAGLPDLTTSSIQLTAYVARGGGSGGHGGGGGGSHGSGGGSHGISSHFGSGSKPGSGNGGTSVKGSAKTGKVSSKPC